MLNANDFEHLVAQVWSKWRQIIPPELSKHLDKVRILVEDKPSKDLLNEMSGDETGEHPEDLCGLYMGTPLPSTGMLDRPLLPDRVYLFRLALLEESEYDGSKSSLKRLKTEIAITLFHEIGHFYGLEEDDLERLGLD